VFFRRLITYKPQNISEKRTFEPISVVISARNEFENLTRFLPQILAQDYPDFEVVVVNDCSDDETAELLDEMARHNPKLKPVHLRQSLNFFQGKKFPLSMGIKSAKNDLLVLTDADCYPESDQWLRTMAAAYSPQTEVVIAYGPYQSAKNLLNRLIRYDTLHIAIQYLSFALAGLPYMGVGRNLSYRKSLFMRNKGFTSHYKIASGDDDLFIHQVANKHNTSVLIQSEDRMISIPKKTFIEWIRQKRRHLMTGSFYALKIKLLLGGYNASASLFYALFVALWFVNPPFYYADWFWLNSAVLLFLFFLKTLIQWTLFAQIAKKLGETGLTWWIPLADFFFVIFTPFLLTLNIFVRKPKWK
jgi:glycosyltransferase involved in cell wall biosynthesis